jgi:broad specificity phosphatase PhoE
MKVYFITHSSSMDNEAGLASGWKDVELSHIGTLQAQEVGNRFQNISIDLICCSDLKRAVETVKIAFRDRIAVVIDKRLREINYGDLNGKPSKTVNGINPKWISEPFPNGESYIQAVDRIHNFFLELKYTRGDKMVLVVGHRATKFGLDTLAGNKTLEECLSTPHEWQPYWEYEL